MGWKGNVRSINSMLNEAQRAAQRRQREAERQQRAAQKMAELERAAYEVQQHEAHLSWLTSIHAEDVAEVDWQAIAGSPRPIAPTPTTEREDEAVANLESYEPSFVDRKLKRAERKQAALCDAVETARRQDQSTHADGQASYGKNTATWKHETELARGVLEGSRSAHKAAIDLAAPFASLDEYGLRVTVDFDAHIPTAAVLVRDADVVPSQTKSLLQSGKLSVKNTPKGKFFEVYQDYVCGAVLRVANELLGLVPVNAVVVTARVNRLNPATGHIEEQPILSVAVPRATMRQLNLQSASASAALTNFSHNVSFKKTQGFGPVSEVDSTGLELGA